MAACARTEKIEKDIKYMFKLFDKNGDKSLTLDELSKGMKSMGFFINHKELQIAIKGIDKNKDGIIDYKEFRDFIMRQYKSRDLESQARESFKLFDKDNSGYIDKMELKHAMKMLGEDLADDEVEKMMNEVDLNGDGKINFEEFLTLSMELQQTD